MPQLKTCVMLPVGVHMGIKGMNPSLKFVCWKKKKKRNLSVGTASRFFKVQGAPVCAQEYPVPPSAKTTQARLIKCTCLIKLRK